MKNIGYKNLSRGMQRLGLIVYELLSAHVRPIALAMKMISVASLKEKGRILGTHFLSIKSASFIFVQMSDMEQGNP